MLRSVALRLMPLIAIGIALTVPAALPNTWTSLPVDAFPSLVW